MPARGVDRWRRNRLDLFEEAGGRVFGGRFPAMTAVIVVHTGVLVAFGDLEWFGPPTIVVAGLVLWHVGVLALARPSPAWMLRDVGSVALVAVAVVADGGTESPLFFWMLLLVAAQVLRHDTARFAVLCGVALAAYLVLVAVEGPTGANAGRGFLFVVYCGALVYGSWELGRRHAQALAAAGLVDRVMASAPVAVTVLERDPLRALYANDLGRDLARQVLEDSNTWVAPAAGDASIDVRREIEEGFEQGSPGGPDVYEIRSPGRMPRFVRFVFVPVELGGRKLLLLFAEDVTVQVRAGEERTRFLEAAAHQFRTPLTPIVAYAEMLAEGTLAEPERAIAVSSIRENARSLEALIDQLTEMLHLRTAASLEAEVCGASEVISQLEATVPRFGEVEVEGDASFRLLTHPESVASALSELIGNGFLHGTPPVRMEWVPNGDTVDIRIRDEGPGPPLQDGTPLGEVWAAGGEDDVVSPGMGARLGLARAAAYAQMAGGSLLFERDDGQWAFVVSVRRDTGTG